MTTLKVGDVITHKAWYGVEYLVIGLGNPQYNEYYLQNLQTLEKLSHPWPCMTEGLIVSSGYLHVQSVVERKIAFMYQRFEKRNESQPTW